MLIIMICFWNKYKNYIAPVITTLVILAIWMVICATGTFSEYVLPSPGKVWNTFLKMIEAGDIWEDIIISLLRVLKGFVIAFLLAFLLGVLTSIAPGSRVWYDFLVQFFRNVPPLSLIPLLILWYGIGETSKTIIIVLASFFPIYLNIVKGITGCDERLLEVGEVFAYTRREKLFGIILPYATADILVGMRIGLGYSWRAIIGAEMVAAASGLGHMILFAQQMSRTDKVIIGIILIGTIGYLSDWIFGLIIKRVLKGFGDNGWQ